MRIDPSNTPVPPHVRVDQSTSATPHAHAAGGSQGAAPLTSVDLNLQNELLQQLVAPQEIRESLVAEIRMKIQMGEYLTQEAAVETADAILNL